MGRRAYKRGGGGAYKGGLIGRGAYKRRVYKGGGLIGRGA